ncbi:2-keto-3-deoxy-L-fuconate dehydrogenase [Povalibacter uvarum]|uniref:2-keto-3-deoxy-L-fuconate dehydrogenase n=2 Tax=Povalibacter uvarum TaxID=732238 RepID=A0A841HEL0_9GAMM|nr:2-keto-3-deoxy-L-fuconate dehydrogenase [Povalibacter uvarum]
MGRAIVEEFLAEGAQVIATDINVEPLAELRGDVEVVQLDVTSQRDACEVAQRFASTNVLVNCAGYVAMGTALECTADDFDASIDVNVRSILYMVQAFLPRMIERRDGAIINIASVVSTTMAAPRRFAYAATKGAVIAMTRSIAFDFGREGIRCNSISPGTVDTPSLAVRLNAAADPDAARTALIQRQPLGRMAQAAEVAAVAVMLASAESSFMSGADVVVDGGISL